MILLSEAMELSGSFKPSEIVFTKADENVDEVMEEANVNIDDVCTGDDEGEMTKTGGLRPVSIGAKDDVVDSVLTTSRDYVLATVRANEVPDDEAELMVDDKADDRAREVESTASEQEMLCFSENDDGEGASIPDSMETYGEKMEEMSGEDVVLTYLRRFPPDLPNFSRR